MQERECREALRAAGAQYRLHRRRAASIHRLAHENAPFEKCFDLAKLFGDHGAEFLLMRSDLQCRINEKTPSAFSIADRVVDYLGKEPVDRFFWGQRRLQPAQTVTRVAIEIQFQGAREKSLFVPERVIEARRRHTHRCREIAHRSGLVAALPEAIHRRLHGVRLIEFSWSGHPIPL